MATSNRRKPCPGAANTRSRAYNRKQQAEYTTWLIREITATVTVGVLVAVVMWSCVLGMSGNFQPGNDVVVGTVAEADDAGR